METLPAGTGFELACIGEDAAERGHAKLVQDSAKGLGGSPVSFRQRRFDPVGHLVVELDGDNAGKEGIDRTERYFVGSLKGRRLRFGDGTC